MAVKILIYLYIDNSRQNLSEIYSSIIPIILDISGTITIIQTPQVLLHLEWHISLSTFQEV